MKMKVLIETEVFSSLANTMLIITIGGVALARQHRIIVQDEAAPAYVSWLGGLGEHVRADWSAVTEDAYLREALEPAKRTIHVVSEPRSDWSCSPPRLSIGDALKLISLPFRILLEDSKSDRNFLVKM